MKYLGILLLIMGCGLPNNSSNPNCVGNSGQTLSCSQGSCSKSGGSGCSSAIDGVYCCGSGGSGDSGGGNTCPAGQCYSFIQNYCCPSYSPYACNGACYSTLSAGMSAGCTNYKTQCF